MLFLYECLAWAPKPNSEEGVDSFEPSRHYVLDSATVEYPDRFRRCGPPECDGIETLLDMAQRTEAVRDWVWSEDVDMARWDVVRPAVAQRFKALNDANEKNILDLRRLLPIVGFTLDEARTALQRLREEISRRQ